MTIPLSLILGLSFVFVIYKWKLGARKRLSLPPGPRPDPIIGHLRLIPSIGQDLFFYQLGKVYGDVLYLRVFWRSIVVLNSVDAAVELLEKRSAIYSDRPKFPIYDLMGLHDALVVVGYGDDFRMYRKMLQQYFSKSRSETYRPMQIREARILAQNLVSSPSRRGELLIRYSAAIIIEIAYGHRILTDNDPYVKIAEDVCHASAHSGPPGGTPVDIFPFLQHFPSWFPGAYYAGYAREVCRPLVQQLYEYPLANVMKDMAEGHAKPSFMAAQLEVLQQKRTERVANIEQIQAAAGILYIAGAETTSSSLSFFFLAMLLFPDCQRQVQEEIDAVVGTDRLPEYHDRERLPYLECLLQETLRWNQAAPSGVPHRSLEDDIYKGMFIPKGSVIIANTRGMTLDENIYKDASAFDPTRFLPKPAGRSEPYPVGTFGFGRRICPGRHLATDSLWIAIATILATMTILNEIGPDGKEIVPDATPIASGITSHPRPFQCRLVARTEMAQFLLKQAITDGGE